MKIEIICATRLSESDFRDNSALGISLRRLPDDGRLIARIAVSNSRGLPDIYNEQLIAADDQNIVAFMHDDVWIDDFFFAQRVMEGLQQYDVIGVVGNRRRVLQQPGWLFVDSKFTWDRNENLSGTIAHSEQAFGSISRFGDAPGACELMDGVFLAARKSTLVGKNCLFDPRFEFDFYDLDFCRTARQKNLNLGTWPICLTHQSAGHFGSGRWQKSLRVYLDKWGA
jgi:glycosyltransferase involved in cell wall biosynthesis